MIFVVVVVVVVVFIVIVVVIVIVIVRFQISIILVFQRGITLDTTKIYDFGHCCCCRSSCCCCHYHGHCHCCHNPRDEGLWASGPRENPRSLSNSRAERIDFDFFENFLRTDRVTYTSRWLWLKIGFAQCANQKCYGL